MLREGDWLGINQILLSLYSVRDINILTQCVMPMLRSLIPYTSGYFLIYDMDGELDVEHSYFYRMQENVKKLYLEQYYGKDYLNGVVDLRSQTITYRDTDILEKELRKHTEIYREFFRPERHSVRKRDNPVQRQQTSWDHKSFQKYGTGRLLRKRYVYPECIERSHGRHGWDAE